MRDRNGNMIGYKKDRKGQPVTSRFTGDALKALAEAEKVLFARKLWRRCGQNSPRLNRSIAEGAI